MADLLSTNGMSYKKGDKFILEIDEVIEVEDVKDRYYRCKNSEIIFNERELKRLIKISETSKEAYRRGYEDGKSEVDKEREEQLAKARAEGAEEAWEFRNKTMHSPSSEEFEWYAEGPTAFCWATYADAKADFEAWKAAQKWEPKVGDVVEWDDERGVILEITTHQNAYVLWLRDGVDICNIEDLTPIGIHVDLSQIDDVMK